MRRAPSRLGGWIVCAAYVVVCLPAVVRAADVRLPDFDSLREKATDSVVISLDESLLGMAGQFLDPSNPQDAKAKSAIQGLKSIQVRSYTFESTYTVPTAEIAALRAQLIPPHWQQAIKTHSESEHSDVDLYIASDGNQAQGLVLIVTEPREFTVVSISGAIDLAKFHSLEGHLGVPKLPADK
jgi:uncharacterized protein DUF4252